MVLCISRPLYPCLSVGLSSFSLNGKMSFLHVHLVGLIRPACPSWSGGSESADTHDRRKNQPFGAFPFRYPWDCESQTRGPSGAASPPFRDHGSSVLGSGPTEPDPPYPWGMIPAARSMVVTKSSPFPYGTGDAYLHLGRARLQQVGTQNISKRYHHET